MKHQLLICNDCECIWERIKINSTKKLILTTMRGLKLSYKVKNDEVIWIPKSPNQKTLFNQSKTQICASLRARNLNYGSSTYPGTAQSYKWALLNHDAIWLT